MFERCKEIIQKVLQGKKDSPKDIFHRRSRLPSKYRFLEPVGLTEFFKERFTKEISNAPEGQISPEDSGLGVHTEQHLGDEAHIQHAICIKTNKGTSWEMVCPVVRARDVKIVYEKDNGIVHCPTLYYTPNEEQKSAEGLPRFRLRHYRNKAHSE
jgi:hypothetical protein